MVCCNIHFTGAAGLGFGGFWVWWLAVVVLWREFSSVVWLLGCGCDL